MTNSKWVLAASVVCLLSASVADAKMKVRSVNKSKNEVQIRISGNSEVVVGDVLNIGNNCQVEVTKVTPKGTRAFAKINDCKEKINIGNAVVLPGEEEETSSVTRRAERQEPSDREDKSYNNSGKTRYSNYMAAPEEVTHILKGFKLGFQVAPAIDMDVKGTNGKLNLESDTLSGISLGYAWIPKPSYEGKNIGFLLNLSALSGTMKVKSDDINTDYSEDFRKALYSSEQDFSVANINFNGVYSINDRFFAFGGLNFPGFTFEYMYSNIEFVGKPGVQIGVGGEIAQDFSAQFTFGKNEYDIEVSGIKAGSIEHGMSRLEMSYTF